MRLGALLATAALALFVLAACGSDGDGYGNGGSPTATEPVATASAPTDGAPSIEIDPCALVTADQAEAVLGAPVGPTQPSEIPPIVSCTYQTNSELLYVQLIVYENEAQARQGFDLAVDVNDFTEIDGLGEDAYNSQPIFDVSVLRGVYELSIDISAGEPETQLEQATELARTALERLP